MGNCQRFGMHFSQIVEDCVSDCQRLSSARTRTRNSFSSFNPPLKENTVFAFSMRCTFIHRGYRVHVCRLAVELGPLSLRGRLYNTDRN